MIVIRHMSISCILSGSVLICEAYDKGSKMSEFQIEKVRLPLKSGPAGGRPPRYPWRELQQGESFFVPGETRIAINYWNRIMPERQYIARKAKKDGVVGLRIWRLV